LDAALLPRAAAARWHHALMDLGATVCTARAPRCDACPVRDLCLAKGREPEPPGRRRATPFASSDRRVRGLILRALRDAPAGLPVAALSRMVGDERVARLASDLEREGLVESADGRTGVPR
ncbi:MAG: A/G-specific adenine glycosylase, partial [Chloroflexota bacterium]